MLKLIFFSNANRKEGGSRSRTILQKQKKFYCRKEKSISQDFMLRFNFLFHLFCQVFRRKNRPVNYLQFMNFINEDFYGTVPEKKNAVQIKRTSCGNCMGGNKQCRTLIKM